MMNVNNYRVAIDVPEMPTWGNRTDNFSSARSGQGQKKNADGSEALKRYIVHAAFIAGHSSRYLGHRNKVSKLENSPEH
jgi:hypothetical protein